MTRKETQQLHAKIAAYIQRHDSKTYSTMSEELKIPIPTLSEIAIKHGIRHRPRTYRDSPKFSVADLLARLDK